MSYSTTRPLSDQLDAKPPSSLHASILYAPSLHDVLKMATRIMSRQFTCDVSFAWCDLKLLGIGDSTINTRVFADDLEQWHSEASFPLSAEQWEPQVYDAAGLRQIDVSLATSLIELDCQEMCVYPIMLDSHIIGGLGFGVQAGTALQPDDMSMLVLLSEQCALGIMNSISQSVVEEQFSTLERLSSVNALEAEYGKQRVDLVMNNSYNAIVFTNAEGLIEKTNDAFATLLQSHLGAYHNHPIWEVARQEDQQAVQDALSQAKEQPEPVQLDVQLNQATQDVYVMLVVSAIMGAKGCVGYVCSMQNISNRIAREEDLRNKLEQERELNLMRSQFVSMASHQFRTPMAIIAAAAQSFVDHFHRMNDEQRQRKLDRIRRQIDRMANMLDDVLTLSDMESHKALLSPKAVPVQRWLAMLVPMYKKKFDTHNFVYESALLNDMAVWADKHLLNRIFDQLVTNATQYSAQQSTITLSLRADDQYVMLSVRDEGIGIPPDEQDRIFESFYRATNAIGVPGTGLGLAILREELRLLDGDIEVDSTLGVGTEVKIFLKKSNAFPDGKRDKKQVK